MTDGGIIEVKAGNVYLKEKEHVSLTVGNYVKISIKDSGSAIKKEAMPPVSDSFYSTKTKRLGLATCHSIVNRHSGAIDVETDPDKGFTFHIYLPAYTTSVKTDPTTIVNYNANGTILVMDDEEVIRDTVSKILKKLGYSVVCKNNGKEALNFFIEETKANRVISGIILDLTIPDGMGGKRVIEEIRTLNKDIPVFVASGYIDDLIMKMPTTYGFTASICKPFRKVELETMLNTHLRTQAID